MQFRLSDVTVYWAGVDSRTPVDHCIADGRDALGNERTWLFRGSEPSEDGMTGSILWPKADGGALTAYGPSGAYVASGRDSSELLHRLVRSFTEETNNDAAS